MTYNLERWTRPENFMAMDDGWQYSNAAFVFLGRHRESDLLTESNFECGLKAIGGESDTVKIVRESHESGKPRRICGWNCPYLSESNYAAILTCLSLQQGATVSPKVTTVISMNIA